MCPPSTLWYLPNNLWHNGSECLFHSFVQLVIVAIAVCSHLSVHNAPQRFVWCGKIRTLLWPGWWHVRCWTMTSPVAQIIFNLRRSQGWPHTPLHSIVFPDGIPSLSPCSYIAGCFWLVAQAAAICSHWFTARGFFYPEDGGDTFLWNVDWRKMYTAPHPRRRHSSDNIRWKCCAVRQKYAGATACCNHTFSMGLQFISCGINHASKLSA
jgi:hypothetical protein